MQTINKHSVLKEVRTKGTWEGYIAPNRVNSYHIKGGWHLGMDILIALGLDGKYYAISHNASDYEELETYVRGFEIYNCVAELGNKVRYWKD